MKFAAAFAGIAVTIAFLGTGAGAVSYSYDRSAPLELTTEDTSEEGNVRIDQISFTSGNRVIHASLVHPKEIDPKSPGVLFVHWFGDAATTNRSEFLPDAMWLARRGAVSLLPDEPWSQPNWFETLRSPATDPRDSIAEVVALRRSIDALLATPGVDPNKIAFVGHDLGAAYGALLAGADSRLAYAVFLAPPLSLSELFLVDTKMTPADRSAYVASMAAFDIPAALGRSTFRGSLLQCASRDAYVPTSESRAFAADVPSVDRTVRTYDADHALAIDAATDERREWLAARLGLQ
jgi:dienelactone hydrolase